MRSSAPALIGDFAINGDGSCFCSTVTGLLGRTARGAKKKRLRAALGAKKIMVLYTFESREPRFVSVPLRFASEARPWREASARRRPGLAGLVQSEVKDGRSESVQLFDAC